MTVTHLPGKDICDFCSEPHPAWFEDAQSFRIQPDLPPELPGQVSVGAWASCDACHELIVAERWLALEDRAYAHMRPKFPHASKHDVRFAVRSIQRQFREYRTTVGWHRRDA